MECILSDQRKEADVLVLPYWQGDKRPVPAFSKEGLDEELLSLWEDEGKGELGENFVSYMKGSVEKRVLFLGLGKESERSLSSFREAFASLTARCRKQKWKNVNCFLPSSLEEEEMTAILDGLWMANYSFDRLKRESLEKKPTVFLERVCFLGTVDSFSSLALKHKTIMASVNLARDLVNGNADEVGPEHLVQKAEELASFYPSLHLEVLKKEALHREGMGLLLAVGRGAEEGSALVVLNYRGDPDSQEVTAVVGKGITFDTGGLNLKPTGSMETMRMDMAGAAAVLGILQAAAALNLRKNVVGVIATAENAIGARAYKPGDVYVSHSGKSVEISNTDAEGRLVLADALSYVQTHYAPTRIIDLATLTGGIVVAIGEEASGLFSNDELLTKALKKASEKTGERVWHMPLYPEYRKMLSSSLADLKNSAAGRRASPCTGAAFLQEFICKGISWAHLDIAGTASLSETTAYQPSSATGVGVKLVLAFLEQK